MTNLQQQRHDHLAEIRKSYWRQYETPQEHEDRADGAEREASRLFAIVTKGQEAAYIGRLRELAGLSSPLANRAREAACAAWYASTKDAWRLYLITVEEYMRDGDLSESTQDAWNALPDFVDLREVA